MSIRIGLDGTPLLGQRAGVGNYTGRLLAALLQMNPDWEYLLYSNRPLGRLEPALAGAIQVDGYLPQSRWLWMQTMLPWVIERSQPALCHFTNSLAPLWQPRPWVLTIHDASLFLYSCYHPHTRLLTVRLILPIIARRAAAIITVSHHARCELLRILDLPEEKVHVVYEAAPRDFRRVTSTQQLAYLRHKYQLPDQFLLYVGTLEPRKNLYRLIRAFAKVRQQGYRHQLVMAGGDGWLMNGFAQEIERLDLQDAVHQLGYIPVADLPGLFSLATLFVFPSLYEGFGLPPLEAMACGTPVLTSNNSSLSEVCADAAHLVDPTNEEWLAQEMRKLLENSEWRAELGRRGLLRARTFSWEQAARQTAAVYEKVLRQNGYSN